MPSVQIVDVTDGAWHLDGAKIDVILQSKGRYVLRVLIWQPDASKHFTIDYWASVPLILNLSGCLRPSAALVPLCRG